MHPANVRAIFQTKVDEYSKLLVTVPNPNQVGTFTLKIVQASSHR